MQFVKKPLVKCVTIIFVFCNTTLFCQDTLTVMHYNLLYYDVITGWCNTSNNNVEDKNHSIKTIVEYVKPAIFTVNELGRNMNGNVNSTADKLLNGALNVNGIKHYARAGESGVSNIVNMVYYNSSLLSLYKQEVIDKDTAGNSLARIINYYTFYYKPNLHTNQLGDTTFIACVVVHLKSGSSGADKAERETETNALKSFLNKKNVRENRMVMGDFNIQSDKEASFINLIANTNLKNRFYDPANSLGSWTSNTTYSAIHTQSTHTGSGGCHAGGGMDDRFDFILASDYIMGDSVGVSIIPNSYKAVGQDGSYYNNSLDTITNSSVPQNVAKALYHNSDHLPVTLKLKINNPLSASIKNNYKYESVKILANNRVEDTMTLILSADYAENPSLSIISVYGQIVKTISLKTFKGKKSHTINMNDLSKGLYFLIIEAENKMPVTTKFLKL